MILDCVCRKLKQVILQMIPLLCLVVKKIATIETVVSQELKLVIKWLRLDKLSLNAGKTELIFFHSKQRCLNYEFVFIYKHNSINCASIGTLYVSSPLSVQEE